jgi:O-antigen ligase
MSAVSLAREVAAVDAAAGIVLLLVPWRDGRRATMSRAFGLALIVVAWIACAVSLVPRDDVEAAFNRLGSPAWAVGVAAGVVVGLGVAAFLVRVILSRPWLWFALLGLALPWRIPVPIGGESRNLLLPLYALLLIGLAAWIVGRLRGRLGARGEASTPLDLPIAAFVAFSLVSILWTSDGREGAVKAVFFLIPFVLLYRLVVAWWRQAPGGRVLAATTIGLAVPVAVLAVVQYAAKWIFWNDRLDQANAYGRFFRVNGIFFDPNILGRFLMVAILAGAATAMIARRSPTVLVALAGCGVCAAGVVVTFSRSTALGLIVALAILAVRAFGWKRTTVVGGALAIVLGAGAIAANTNVRRALTDADRLERVSEGRFDLVKGGLEVWAEDPIAGTGLGAFANRYEEILTPEEQRRARVVISHNAPITVLTEVGLIGFALFLILGAATIRALLRAAGPAPQARALMASGTPDVAGWTALTALAMLAGIFVHSLLYSALFEDPYTWVIAAAGVAVLGSRAAEAPPLAPEVVPPVPVQSPA